MKKLVLLIEDDPDLRELLHTQLSDLGLEVVDTDCAEKATQIINDLDRIDLAIADYKLAGTQSGMDVVRWTRSLSNSRKSNIKFILMTGNYDKFDPKQASELGVLEFLPKPFDSLLFVDVINSVLGTSYSI